MPEPEVAAVDGGGDVVGLERVGIDVVAPFAFNASRKESETYPLSATPIYPAGAQICSTALASARFPGASMSCNARIWVSTKAVSLVLSPLLVRPMECPRCPPAGLAAS